MKLKDIEFVKHWIGKVNSWKGVEKEIEKAQKNLENEKEKLVSILKKRYKLFSDDNYNLERVYEDSDIGKELNMILRSGMKRKKNIRMGDAVHPWGGYDYFYVNESYGLKLPYLRYGLDPLNRIESGVIPELENDKFVLARSKDSPPVVQVNFSYLRNASIFKAEKLNVYLRFLRCGMKLRALEIKTKQLPSKLKGRIDMVDSIDSRWSRKKNVLKILNNLETLDVAQILFKTKTKKFFGELETFKLEIKEYNKPYKVLKKLTQ